MEGNLEVTEIMQNMLPSGSKIIKIEDYYRIPAVVVSDLDQEYFNGIANYYLGLIETQGANPVYLYHLATSEFNSGNLNGAINTLNVLAKSNYPYPSKTDVVNLLNEYTNEVNKKAKS